MWVSEDDISYTKANETFSLNDHLLIDENDKKKSRKKKSRKESSRKESLKGNEEWLEKWEDKEDEDSQEKYGDLARENRRILRNGKIIVRDVSSSDDNDPADDDIIDTVVVKCASKVISTSHKNRAKGRSTPPRKVIYLDDEDGSEENGSKSPRSNKLQVDCELLKSY